MTDPFDNPAIRAMRALQERDEEMRRLAEGPAFSAARELQDSPAMQSIRQLQEREEETRRVTETDTLPHRTPARTQGGSGLLIFAVDELARQRKRRDSWP